MSSSNQKSKLIAEQINKLLDAHSKDFKKESDMSPMVHKLVKNEVQERNVMLLKRLFEHTGHVVANKEEIEKQPRLLSKARHSLDCFRKIASPPTSKSSSTKSPSTNRIDKIVRELMQKERDYIETLEKGIENYLKPIATMSESNDKKVPEDIRNQKFKLFSNIEEIQLLHKSTVLPHLLSCGDNIHQIAETFINLVQSNAFYCYINYAINHKQAQELLLAHGRFFAKVQKNCNDQLGVMSFIIQPIQKVPRYPLILEEMIKELSEDMHGNKKTLASLCIAKKSFERFLRRLNQAMTINDIIETQSIPANLQCGLITCLQIEFGVSINEPTLLLIPTFTSAHGYRSTFNIFALGNFLKTEFFNVHEHYTKLVFPAKIFLFEKCLLYTRVSSNDKKTLSYRDHYMFGVSFNMQLKQHQEMMLVGDTVSQRYVSFESDDFESIHELYEQIQTLQNLRQSGDSAFAEMEQSFDENFVNEGMAETDWVTTDIDMIKMYSSDGDKSQDLNLWIDQGTRSGSGGKSKKKKSKVDSKSRFYVSTPNASD